MLTAEPRRVLASAADTSGKKDGTITVGTRTEPGGPKGVVVPGSYFLPGKSGEPWDHGLERSGTVAPRLERSDEAL